MVHGSSGRVALAVVWLLGLTLAGCLSEDPDPIPATGGEPDEEDVSADRGMVTVSVVDPGQVGIENVTVRLGAVDGDRTKTTNVLGLARFKEVSPGEARVVAQKEGYHSANATFDIAEGAHLEPTLELVSETAEPYVIEHRFEGFFDCSATYLIITGDCFVLVKNVTEEAGAGMPLEPTNEDFIFDFEVQEDWRSVRIRQEWDDPEFSLGTMMRVNLEPYVPDHGGHTERYARTEGESPITMELEVGTLHENASTEDMVIPADGGLVQTRTFHLGPADLHNPGGTEFLGAGIAYQQRFTITVEIEYEA